MREGHRDSCGSLVKILYPGLLVTSLRARSGIHTSIWSKLFSDCCRVPNEPPPRAPLAQDPLALPGVAEPDLGLLRRDAHLGCEQLVRRVRRLRCLLENSLELFLLLGSHIQMRRG